MTTFRESLHHLGGVPGKKTVDDVGRAEGASIPLFRLFFLLRECHLTVRCKAFNV